ncbi:acyltransferase family protein [Pseudokineococcus sp. 1T1Z-3]|uniref:acyltransferase family protein n=1 Tax=Pseudokineococcus sp. 1T1Z-3 TaxID=3132745 RepID=UPI00309A5FE3
MGEVTTPGGERLAWVDRARGAAILLVVLHHCVAAALAQGLLGERVPAVDALLAGVRMPLFFLVSGLLAARALERPWRALLRGKVLVLLWLYLLWMVLGAALYSVVPYARHAEADPGGAWGAALLGLALPDNSLWYLYALAVFTVLGRLLRRVPTAALLLGAALVSVTVVALVPEPETGFAWQAMARLVPFFLAGARLPGVLAVVSTAVPWGWGVLALLACPTLVLLAWWVPAGVPLPGAHLLTGVVGVVGAVVVTAALPATRPVEALARLGRVTLPLYVLHELVLSVVMLPLREPLGAAVRALAPSSALATALLSTTVVLLLLALTLAGTQGLRRLLAGLPGLFTLPRGPAGLVGERPRATAARRP